MPPHGSARKATARLQHARTACTYTNILSSTCYSGNVDDKNSRKKRKIRNRETVTHTKKTGIISLTQGGRGFVTVPGFDEDIVIASDNLHTALHGDTVNIVLLPQRPNKRLAGKVVDVLTRAKTQYVGTIETRHGTLYAVPDDRKMYVHILLAPPLPKEAVVGMKVLVRMSTWTDPKQMPEGTILQVLGPSGTHETELKAIVIGAGFDTHFPPDVEKEADKIKDNKESFIRAEIARRRDFRAIPTFTIDPSDAKDFDDAISIQTLSNGHIEVGVHIADVSAYVTENDAIDTEAQKRGTSIYLVDRTIPMLPEVLSNDVCSLNPNEDKLTFSAVFIVDKNGSIHDRWFGETVIRSARRFAYEEAQEVLDRKKGDLYEELSVAWTIASALRDERFKKGSIAFETEEIKFRLDQNGKPIEAYIKPRLNTNLLIEDCMLLANREVATFISNQLAKKIGGVFVYRVHDLPKEDRLSELEIFLRAIGHELDRNKDGTIVPREFNRLFEEIKGTPEQDLIETATVRAMAKAVYTTKNIGHFGLAFDHYTHFTSPIRRYPDLMVHRILKSHLSGTPISAQEYTKYERLALQSSEREVAAVEAERESIKYKQVEFLSTRIGETFNGIISGVTEWGFYVEELTTKAEGLVRLSSLADDYYVLDEKNYRIIGEKTKKIYALGDKVKITLVAADIKEKQITWKVI